MAHSELHRRIADVAPELLFSSGAAEAAEVEAHAALGCSVCARALVNARDVATDLAHATAIPDAPAHLRVRVLASARDVSRSVARDASTEADGEERLLDASSATAALHIGAPDDEVRIRVIDELGALQEREGELTSRFLAQAQRLISFPLLFVSIVRGTRVGYRVQRGLEAGLMASRDLRREITFCTHCVSAGAPLVVPSAAREPFFRGSKMVKRFGVGAYVGVPLRSEGQIIGTLCALDFKGRPILPETVQLLQLFAEPVISEIENAPDIGRDGALERLSTGLRVYHRDWLNALLAVELARADSGRPTALLGVSGPSASCLAELARPDEIVGRLESDALGLLASGAGLEEAARRASQIRAQFPGIEVRFAVADGPVSNPRAFRARALGRS